MTRLIGPSRRVGLIATTAALLAALALSACGSSLHPAAGANAATVPAAKGATGAAPAPAGGAPAPTGGASSGAAVPVAGGGSHGGVTPSSTSGTGPAGGATAGGATAGGAAASGSGTASPPTTVDTKDGQEPESPPPAVLDPCSLVTGAEAQAILGTPVAAPTSAPLGPTCVYKTTGGSAVVTMSLQALDVAKVTPLMQNVAVVQEAGHATYCGMYGQATLLAPINQRTALDIVAACPVAQKFAALALPRLH